EFFQSKAGFHPLPWPQGSAAPFETALSTRSERRPAPSYGSGERTQPPLFESFGRIDDRRKRRKPQHKRLRAAMSTHGLRTHELRRGIAASSKLFLIRGKKESVVSCPGSADSVVFSGDGCEVEHHD